MLEVEVTWLVPSKRACVMVHRFRLCCENVNSFSMIQDVFQKGKGACCNSLIEGVIGHAGKCYPHEGHD